MEEKTKKRLKYAHGATRVRYDLGIGKGEQLSIVSEKLCLFF